MQAHATIGAAEFAAALRSDIDSPLFGEFGRSRTVRALLRIYWYGVRAVLGRPPNRASRHGVARSSA